MPISEKWVSWEEAARITGIRVPTIEHAVRVNRIVRRSARGHHPTLDLASVLEWAAWHREVQIERAQRRAAREQRQQARPERAAPRGLGLREILSARRPTSDPDPITRWLTVEDAALALTCSESSVLRWVRAGGLEAKLEGRVWVSGESVDRLIVARAADEQEWVSQADAAQVVGCSRGRIPELIKEGLLVQRPGPRWRASISRESAVSASEVWSQRVRGTELKRDERRRTRPTNEPPDDGHVWVTTTTAALTLGLTRNGVGQRIRAGTLPGTRRGNRYWLRRQDVEVAAAARAFTWRRNNNR
ncbi:helix-turn-helix domain-containing protein [Nocardioides okcheonensis]|uniref:helix-turn-helix domain-containing protein n=1 Tax=Nocardioides okcheonensis TaxID=2894081 RepID=UPI001E36B351|nr:helix-turn-helix domain-containing protein [Nocardioides okcheonensis]UFN45201.1 helix-turn-helix domain-containing protein [Nocardioides okcheonensis]